jgi:hypothetical protein
MDAKLPGVFCSLLNGIAFSQVLYYLLTVIFLVLKMTLIGIHKKVTDVSINSEQIHNSAFERPKTSFHHKQSQII